MRVGLRDRADSAGAAGRANRSGSSRRRRSACAHQRPMASDRTDDNETILVVRNDMQLGHLDELLRSYAPFVDHVAKDLVKNLGTLYTPLLYDETNWGRLCAKELKSIATPLDATPLDHLLAALRVLGHTCCPARVLETAIYLTHKESATLCVMKPLLARMPRAATDAWPDAKKAWRDRSVSRVFADSCFPEWSVVAPPASEACLRPDPREAFERKLADLGDQLGAEIATTEAPATERVREFITPPLSVRAREDAVLARLRSGAGFDARGEGTIEAQKMFYHWVQNAVRRVRPCLPDGYLRPRAVFALSAPDLRREIENALEMYYRALDHDHRAVNPAPAAEE